MNDDSSVALTGSFVRQDEGNDGTTIFAFGVTRTGDLSMAHSVFFAVVGGGLFDAPTGADFAGGVLPSGVVTFAPGEATKSIEIAVVGDSIVEETEQFTLTLLDPSIGLTITGEPKTGIIDNDDLLPLALYDDAYVVWGFRLAAVVGVLRNDDGAANPSITSGPAHGTLDWSNGTFDYRPFAGFSGIDHFTYRVTAGGVSQEAQVTLHVVPMTDGFFHTVDVLALTPEEKIAATYVAFFGRAADAAGFEFWLDQFHAGQATQAPAALIANIASSFAVSEEARAQYEFLANPGAASDSQIGVFLDEVYGNLFGRPTEYEGRSYWTSQIRQKLAANEYVGSVLIDIIGGAQNQTGFFAHQDVSTLMGKVAVGLAFVHEQQANGMVWAGASDVAAATALLTPVTREYASVLIGVRHAEELVAEHA